MKVIEIIIKEVGTGTPKETPGLTTANPYFTAKSFENLSKRSNPGSINFLFSFRT